MSKNTNQEAEAPEEPEYVEPEYKSTLGKKEKQNDDALNQLMKQAKMNKKGKKNRKEHQSESSNLESSASSSQNLGKKKKIVITDLNELNNMTFANAPHPAATAPKDEPTIEKYSQAQYQNTAILATVSGQIDESDIQRFFNGLSISKIHPETGYYIIEFSTEEDLRKALQKNKTPYTNNITVLIGEYSIEDENPKPEKHETRLYQSSRNSYSHEDLDDDYSQSGGFRGLSIGSKYQQPQTENKYAPKKAAISIGNKFQQQGEVASPKPNAYRTPYSQQSSAGKYKPSFLNKESTTSIPAANNRFGNLKDGE